MRRLSIVNNDYSAAEQLTACMSFLLSGDHHADALAEKLSGFLGNRRCFLTACGFSALSIILKTLKEEHPDRSEVVFPAYTAPGLVLPVQKLGLKVRLCDVSLETFTIDPLSLGKTLNNRTLAVIAVHMFGIPCDLRSIMNVIGNDIPVIEDCAQSLGSEFEGRRTGSITPISFGSFGRGKNFSLYNGGFLAVDSPRLATAIEHNYHLIPREPARRQLLSILMSTVFAAATSPVLYYTSGPFLQRLKSSRERQDFDPADMGSLTASFASRVFDIWQKVYRRRIDHGLWYFERLRQFSSEIRMPKLADGSSAAFNRFPVLVNAAGTKDRLLTLLWKNGIEGSCMYRRPVHHVYPEIGYAQEEFPNAVYLAEHLLTLPVHGLMRHTDILRISKIFAAATEERS